jgi:D-alanyl-D-alanine carboxypeptidase
MSVHSSRRLLASVVALALVVSIAGTAAAQNEQERIAKAWVEAFNGGVDAMATFRASHTGEPERAGWRDQYGSMREDWGRLEVQGIMIDQMNEVILGLATENEGRMRLVFVFNDANKLVGLRLGEGRSNSVPALALPEDIDNVDQRIDAYLSQLEADGILSGSVLLARDGNVWFERAYGLASREFNVPNNINTRFDVGSFNKDYTRLAIMQLLQDDRLALSDKVGEYLTEYPNERVRNEVTIQQLLDHRAGLGDMFTAEYFSTPMGSLREIDDYIPIWGPKPLEYEPGTRTQYSNFGYTLLGAIVENITGVSYPEYVEEHVFKPAGMDATGFFATDGIEPNVAVGYTTMERTGRPGDTVRKNIFHEPVKGGPWGKSYSTARDLFRFFDAMFAGKLIGDELNWMPDGWSGGMGLAGGGPGLSTILLVENDVAVIVLANQDAPGAENIARRLMEALR